MEEVLPSEEEVTQVFRDYKQMLQATKFRTPLQRANEIHSRQKSIALSQKMESEAEHVFNLLPPGHKTCLSVDFFRILLNCQQNVYLRIPVTLIGEGETVTLLRTSQSGQILYKTYANVKSAFPAFDHEVGKSGLPKPYFPRFIHKVHDSLSRLFFSLDLASQSWQHAGNSPQRLQQFIHPHSKSVSLIRAHWKESQTLPTYYFISHGLAQGKGRRSLVDQKAALGRSFSEANVQIETACINRASSNLIIQRTKSIPDLDKSLQECIRLLSSTLKSSRRLSELVCDFTPDSSHQWVFLACKGFSFKTKGKIRTQLIELKEKIDVKFLMFPLLAQKNAVQYKLTKTLTNGNRRRMGILRFAHGIGNSSMDASPIENLTEGSKSFEAQKELPRPESVIMEREVRRYDSLVKGSREYKEIVKGTVDIVEKYGGVSFWRPALQRTYRTFFSSQEVVNVYFDENMGIEQHSLVVNALLRVIKGDYNFYYKEALKKLHSRSEVSKVHYQMFLREFEQILQEVHMSPADYSIVFTRFQQLEEYICVGEAGKRRGDLETRVETL